MQQLQLYQNMNFKIEGETESHIEYLRLKSISLLTDLRFKWIGIFIYIYTYIYKTIYIILLIFILEKPESIVPPYTGDTLRKNNNEQDNNSYYYCNKCSYSIVPLSCILPHDKKVISRQFFPPKKKTKIKNVGRM